jgi:hypothetical protein
MSLSWYKGYIGIEKTTNEQQPCFAGAMISLNTLDEYSILNAVLSYKIKR